MVTALSMNLKLDANGSEETHLAEIIAQATLKYSVKDYDAAAELYSRATELQAEINGEMSLQNAELLYAYGRCLYHVAVKNSDVLGTKVAGEKQDTSKATSGKKLKSHRKIDEINSWAMRIPEDAVTKIVEEKDGPSGPEREEEKSAVPYFQITGDENWDTSEDQDQNDQEDEDGAEGEEDDFVNAFEVLDLARILLLKKLADTKDRADKTEMEEQDIRQLKERLADTHDLQAEISLEAERFPIAVIDLKSALDFKTTLYPQESSIVAEAHYKLSLALEFSSVTQQKDANGKPEGGKEVKVDEEMRAEAASEMEAAIRSCQMRIRMEESNLKNDPDKHRTSDKLCVTEDNIKDVKEMVMEMEQRLIELQQPPVSVNDPLNIGTVDGTNPLTGILGSILGEDPAAQRAKLEEASEGARDLTTLVKRKGLMKSDNARSAEDARITSNGKRRADSTEEVKGLDSGKKFRISRSE